MSAESAAEKISHRINLAFDKLDFPTNNELASIIREETRCDQLAEALRNMDAAAFRLRERLRTISGLSSGTNESIYNEACYYAEDDVFAETRALLAEIDAPAREGEPDA